MLDIYRQKNISLNNVVLIVHEKEDNGKENVFFREFMTNREDFMGVLFPL